MPYSVTEVVGKEGQVDHVVRHQLYAWQIECWLFTREQIDEYVARLEAEEDEALQALLTGRAEALCEVGWHRGGPLEVPYFKCEGGAVSHSLRFLVGPEPLRALSNPVTCFGPHATAWVCEVCGEAVAEPRRRSVC